MSRSLLAFLCWMFAGLVGALPAGAAGRIAFVVGNAAYQHAAALPKAANDARAMGDMLRRVGFDVVEASNVGNLEFKRLIRTFEDKAADADVAVVYFSGYGIARDRVNYLVPVDARLAGDRDVEDEAVALDRVLAAIEPVRTLQLVILDASWGNPFAASWSASAVQAAGRGLARVEPTSSNTLVAFAASAGSVAQDGGGANSVFTAALLKNLPTPGLDIRLAFGRVRDEVVKATGNAQEPYVYGSLGGGIVALSTSGASPAPVTDDDTRRDYDLVAQVGTRKAWEVFLSTHPTGRYADLARSQIARLEAESAQKTAALDSLPPPAPAPRVASDDERRAWNSVRDTNDVASLRSFIARYPGSPFAVVAQQRLDVVERQAVERAQQRVAEARKLAEERAKQAAQAEAAGARKAQAAEAAAAKRAAAEAEAEAKKAAAAEQAERKAVERQVQEARKLNRIQGFDDAGPRKAESEKEAAAKRAAAKKAAAAEEAKLRAVERAAEQKAAEQNVVEGASRPAETVDRYPTIEAPERVAAGAKTTVLVSLTVDQVTPEVAIGATAADIRRTPSGALRVPLPRDRARIPLTVILNAPGFDLDAKTPQQATIELDRNGDSTVARFDIIARRGEPGSRALRVTFWRDGEFLASAARKIEVVETPVGAAMPGAAVPALKAASKQQRAMVATPLAAPAAALRISSLEPVSLSADRRPIDLTVEMIYDDPRTFSRGSVTLASRYFPHTIQSRFEASPDLASWIEGFYREFRAEAERDDSGDTPAVAAARRDARLARLRAFGDELYRRAAPAPLKRALATLLADPSVTLRTIQVYSNNPLVPWELMRAPKAKGESKGGSTDFFGIAFALARWHEDDERAVVRPLQDQPIEEVVAVAPAYGGQQALAAPVREIEQIQALLAMRQVAGRRADFIDLIRRPPSGIVHFAGHGEVAGRTPVERRFVIRFEDGLFDVMEWRGLTVSAGRSRALFFFNACDVGQAESMAGVVDGWGPAALAKGASGYIGGLWPLRDDPAARFAVAFYQVISTRLQQGERASVADALAEARRLVYQTGDATYLAYAFYGDAQLEFVRRQ